jgi:hypothetical protein
MVLRRELRLLGSLLTLCGSAFAQCYDLRSTQLSDPQGRFQEWWDKPIWHAKPGEGNFTVDNTTWGRAMHFAVFAVGTVRKTPQGWTTQRLTHHPETWCDPTPERSGVFCYLPPYQIPPPSATIRAVVDEDFETWVVSTDGTVRYERHRHGVVRMIENRSSYRVLPDEFGYYTATDVVATIDLNRGVYVYEEHSHGAGAYIRRYPGTGVKIRTIDTFRAQAKLTQVPCPVSTQGVALSAGEVPSVVELNGAPLCVVKVSKSGSHDPAPKQLWEFVQNAENVPSWEGCLVVFEGAGPHSLEPLRMAQKRK